jgi:hypothetical protein
VVNTGAISQTSYQPTALQLPAGQTLYARIYTELGGSWYPSSDISFSGIQRATLTAPLNGSTTVDLAQPLTWSTIAGAQGYYLYVGTTPGANNVVNTGAISQTSYQPTALQLTAGQTLYARIYTELGGSWYPSSDISFSGVQKATFTSPSNGATNVGVSPTIQWTTIAGAQAYYLYVGTTPGTHGLVNTGEISQTSYQATGLPSSGTLYARIFTKIGGVWYYADISFTTQ